MVASLSINNVNLKKKIIKNNKKFAALDARDANAEKGTIIKAWYQEGERVFYDKKRFVLLRLMTLSFLFVGSISETEI